MLENEKTMLSQSQGLSNLSNILESSIIAMKAKEINALR